MAGTLHANGVVSARAALAEHEGRSEKALVLYADAANRWHEYGFVFERALALLGQGRALESMGRPGEAAAARAEGERLLQELGAVLPADLSALQA